MAEKIIEGRRMSRNILSENAASDETYINENKTGGKKNGEKHQIELYHPQTGMSMRRNEDQLWRNSKSPSPCPIDSFNKNCQVNQTHGKSKTFNKKFESGSSTNSLSRSEQNLIPKNNEIISDIKNFSVTVESGGDVINDLTFRTAEEKKKVKKPEKAIYVPKPISQIEKESKLPQRRQKSSETGFAKSEEEIVEENVKSSGNDIKKKKKARGRGRPREERELEEKEFRLGFKVESSKKHFDSNLIQKQSTTDNCRFQREHKNDKRNYNQKRHDEKKKENNKTTVRKPNDILEHDSRSNSPDYIRNQQNFNVKTDKRDFRQNSEPRIIPYATNIRSNNNNNPNNRLRDTRSMEHSNWGDKIQSKPPAGRRGSGIVSVAKQATFDSLPPRLKKKYMEEKGMTMSLPPNSFIGTSSEEQWDGGSLSFLNNSSTHSVEQYQRPATYQPFQNYLPQQWSQKISPKGRGRGRLKHDEAEKELQLMEQSKIGQVNCRSPSGSTACVTPFKNISQSHEHILQDRPSGPHGSLPSRSFSSHDQIGPYEDRYYDYTSQMNPRYQRDYDSRKGHFDGRGNQWKDSKTVSRRNQYEKGPFGNKSHRMRKLSNSSNNSNPDLDGRDIKQKNNESKTENSASISDMNTAFPVAKCSSPRALDWSEEVEESERQEREAMSRSSSVTSLSNTHTCREKRKQRRRGGRKDRSLSRESGRFYRNNSQEKFRNQRRQSDENVYRPGSRDQNKGHYGFHRNLSRESSREREHKSEILDWRQAGDQEKNDKDWRKGNDFPDKSDKDWRREKEKLREEEREDKGNWRNDKRKKNVINFDTSVPSLNNQTIPGYQQRGFLHLQQSPQSQQPQRQLFDPSNPSKPIIVNFLNSRVSNSVNQSYQDQPPRFLPLNQYPQYHFQNDSLGDGVPNMYHKDASSNRPSWYDHTNESFRSHRNPVMLMDIKRADADLQYIVRYSKGPSILHQWQNINYVRQFLQKSLQILLMTEIKFCQEENVEQHMWRITYYNLIETLRNSMSEDSENKEGYKNALLAIVDEGIKYFERLIQLLEENYNFKVETFLASNSGSTKGLGYTGLVVVSTQKIMLFLGDLARYREVANDSNNYGKSKQWYTKAQQLNPKNGRPYYQLALLAYLARRKLDAVYYYMRSLMASNPQQSARESLLSLFDDNRKKYEQIEKKKREERESKYKERVKEKEASSLRREIWVHPCGTRRRVHRTTSTSTDSRRANSEDEELLTLESTDINKRFTTSYLHVHGKLFGRVGMETFQDAGLQMLREFRALLRQTPLPLGCTRFLQLLALNMFAIENTQLKDTNLESGYRSAVQENALIISLQMFSLILEKCVALLREQLNNPPDPKGRLVGDDVQVLLPAIKVWCDWLICHVNVWNPPPNCSEYRVGPPVDAWNRLAFLVNLLEKLDYKKITFATSQLEGFEVVRLPEDAALAGFTPLLLTDQDQIYTSSKNDMELAQCCLTIRKILFVGTVFLCGTEPPVLKLQKYDNYSEFISVVDSSGHSQSSPTEDQSDAELMVESFSEEECEDHQNNEEKAKTETPLSLDALEMATSPSAVETRRLLIRKEELEKKHQRQEKHRKRVQAILQQSGLSVVIEVKPKYLVPDTNCFIDYLELLQKIAACCASGMEPYYILTIPLIVLNELEGLARGGRDRDLSHLTLTEQEHAADVSDSARAALAYLRSPMRSLPTIRCVTTRGKFINSFTTFMVEDDIDRDLKNDDRILATCISLCRNAGKEQTKPGDPRHLVREVVLLTEDRNLRVKALARDVPVREVPDFAQWAGLG